MTKFIVFSKDRPLQLHGYLSSFFKLVRGAEVVCLVMARDPYAPAYRAIEVEFPQATFVYETDFAKNTAEITATGEYFCFGCDDVVFIRETDCALAESLLSNNDLLGVSLRLGTCITRGMFGAEMRQPAFEMLPNGMMRWELEHKEIFNPWGGQGDWVYPWEVLGSIYTRKFVMAMWTAVADSPNPSLFEEDGAKNWTEITPCRSYASWTVPRSINPTINVVSSSSSNGVIGPCEFDPSFLLDCWVRGLRMDTARYAEYNYDSWRVGDLFLSRVADESLVRPGIAATA